MLEEEYAGQLIQFENHVSSSDPFVTSETTARANWYGVGGIPHVVISGKHNAIGAGGCESAANTYRSYINQDLAQNGGISPIAIEGSFLPFADEIQATATFRLEDPANLTSLRATLLVYENDVYWCCGYGGNAIWDGTTRDMYDQYITLTNVGDEATVSFNFPVPSGGPDHLNWDPTQCHVVAYLQTTTGNKEIFQGARLPIGDFSFEFAKSIGSVPDGNGQVIFDATLTNISDVVDTYTLQPGTPFGDWTTDFKVCGDPNWYAAPHNVVLNPDESCEVQVRVTTNGAVEVRDGTFEVTSDWSARTVTPGVKVFNGSYSVFFVDNDSYATYETPIRDALDANGYLYTFWDVYNDHANSTPGRSFIAGYDYVIWHTGFNFSSTTLGASDQGTLMNYMDNGGRVLLSSQMLLNNLGTPNAFATDYLGVTSWTLDAGYEDEDGVAGDPISDGLDMHSTYSIPTFMRPDDAHPGPTATTFLTAPNGSQAGIRNEFGENGKCIFLPFAMHTIDDNADPNNLRVFLTRMMEWLAPSIPQGVEDGLESLSASRIQNAQPNPFNPRTEIAFMLSRSGAAGPVTLEVFDLAGRKVASLFNGNLSSGPHTETWTGYSDAGSPVESGAYFALLTTREGKSSKKLILLK